MVDGSGVTRFKWASSTAPRPTVSTLSDATERASRAVGELYADHPDRSIAAELQFAIYPWAGGAGDVILDIKRDGTEMVATDIQGSAIDVRGRTLDDLVARASDALPDKSKAMLRWIRPVAELQVT